MPKYEEFHDTIKVAEKTEKQGTKGIYFSCKTEKNLVYNFSEKVINECGGKLPVGSTVDVKGVVLPPKDGYPHGSRWVNSFNLTDKSQEAKPSIPVEGKKHDGWRMGQALNIGVLMATSIGTSATDEDWWPVVFSCADEALNATYTYEIGVGKFKTNSTKPSGESEISF